VFTFVGNVAATIGSSLGGLAFRDSCGTVVNELVTLSSLFSSLTRIGNATFYTIAATFTADQGFDICNGGFQILQVEMSSGGRLPLFSLNGRQNGFQTGDFAPFSMVAFPGQSIVHLEKGQSASFEFRVPVRNPVSILFFVNMVGERTTGSCTP
jgi:hypothetical protein